MTTPIAAVIGTDDAAWLAGAGVRFAVAGQPALVLMVSADRAARVLAELPADAPPVIIIGDPASAPADPRVKHVVRRGLGPEHLTTLLASAATGPALLPASAALTSAADARTAQRAFAASRRLAGASDLAATESIATDAIVDLVDADRAVCLFHDGEDGALWSEARLRGPGDERRATGGLAGFAARTGHAIHSPRAGRDLRWLAAIDDPRGAADDHILVQPVAGPDGAVHAVLVAARSGRRDDFGEVDLAVLARFAALVAPFLDQLSIHAQAQALLDQDADGGLFRREAIEAQAAPRWGDVVRVAPPWLSWAYWILVVLLVGAGLFITLGTVSTYSAGAAVIRATSRAEITARTAGNVTSVAIEPGTALVAGTVVARLDDSNQRAALERTQQEFDAQLRNHMLDFNDGAADASVRALRNELDAVRAALEDRVVRAAAAGVVSDVRIRPGQHVEPGDIVASVVVGEGGLEVVALFPGEDRPQLSAGQTIRLELAGYRYAYQTLTIDSVSSDVIAPTEARRVLGAEVADSLQLTGPVVVVRGRLPTREFESDGKRFVYHDGMLGRAEVRMRSERIVYALVPGARRLR